MMTPDELAMFQARYDAMRDAFLKHAADEARLLGTGAAPASEADGPSPRATDKQLRISIRFVRRFQPWMGESWMLPPPPGRGIGALFNPPSMPWTFRMTPFDRALLKDLHISAE
jgi:hypothetical protein